MKQLKKSSLILLIAMFFTVVGFSQSTTQWTIDKAHSSVNFEINHIFTTVQGNFNEFDGEFYFDPEDLVNSKLSFTVNVKSIDTNNERRDGHLVSADFFDAETYPNMSFVSTEIRESEEEDEDVDEQEFIVIGNLTIKDVTKEIEIELDLEGVVAHPMKENTTLAGLEFETEINRNDFGVGAGDWASTAIIGNRVEIFIPMEVTSPSQ